MILCKNCHWLYDYFLLNRGEFEKIKTKVAHGLQEYADILKLHFDRKLFGDEKFVKEFTKWASAMNEVIERFYADTQTTKTNRNDSGK